MEGRILTPRKQGQARDKAEELKAKEIHSYIQNRVMPVFGPLQLELLLKQPVNIKEYCIEWLHRYSNKTTNEDPKELFSDEQPDDVFIQKRKKKLKNKRRKGVSGDSTPTWLMQKQQQKGEVWPEEIKVNLMMYLKKCIFFQHLSHESLERLISRGKSKAVTKEEVVLREGQSGNALYLVLQGRFKCEKLGSSQILKEYKAGEVFGELALLYNHPRATTITAISTGKLFELDRKEFSLILRSKMLEKLRECQALVDRIEFFKDLDVYERMKLFETLGQRRVAPQKYIIREGELGSCFYIVAEGQLVAYKAVQGENKLVYAYKRGDYFGQIALLRNVPRQASIKALTETRLYYINRESFIKIIGPLEGVLSRSCDRYAIWGGQLSGEGEI